MMNYKEIDKKSQKEEWQEWRTSVHHLKQSAQIMHIIPDEDEPSKIFFEFFEDSGNYTRLGRESALRHEFGAAMVASDLRTVKREAKREFIVILFSIDYSKIPFTMIRFTERRHKKRKNTNHSRKILRKTGSQ